MRDEGYERWLAQQPNDVMLSRRDRENLVAVGSFLDDNVLETWVRTNFGQEELTGGCHVHVSVESPADAEPPTREVTSRTTSIPMPRPAMRSSCRRGP